MLAAGALRNTDLLGQLAAEDCKNTGRAARQRPAGPGVPAFLIPPRFDTGLIIQKTNNI
jgi:hypothetical protein